MFRQNSTWFLGVGEGGCWFCIIEDTAEVLFLEREKQICQPFYWHDILFFFDWETATSALKTNELLL